MTPQPPFGFEWDNVNQEWILTDCDGDEISRHRYLIDAEEAASNQGSAA